MDKKETPKVIYAHKGFFSRESRKLYRENSLELFREANRQDYISAIEIDVRKSKDGVLYCYHGNIFQYFFVLRRHNKTFAELRAKYGVERLADILEVISEDKLITLDLKDTTVTRADILAALNDKKFREIVLGNKSVNYLRRFENMPPEFSKMINLNFFSIFYNLAELKKENFKYFEIFYPLLATRKKLAAIEESGLEFVGFPAVFFFSEKSYLRALEKYGIKYIAAELYK